MHERCSVQWVVQYIGWVNIYQIFEFQRPKVPKQANFCRSLQNSLAGIELSGNLLALSLIKLYKMEICSKVPMSKISKTYLHSILWKTYGFYQVVCKLGIYNVVSFLGTYLSSRLYFRYLSSRLYSKYLLSRIFARYFVFIISSLSRFLSCRLFSRYLSSRLYSKYLLSRPQARYLSSRL